MDDRKGRPALMTVLETVCAMTNLGGAFVVPDHCGTHDVEVLLIKRSSFHDGYYVEALRGDGAFMGKRFHKHFNPLTIYSLMRFVGEFATT